MLGRQIALGSVLGIARIDLKGWPIGPLPQQQPPFLPSLPPTPIFPSLPLPPCPIPPIPTTPLLFFFSLPPSHSYQVVASPPLIPKGSRGDYDNTPLPACFPMPLHRLLRPKAWPGQQILTRMDQCSDLE